ncbi:MAG TPA: hypothetical protein PLL35_04515 [Candidatus Cloacimonas sp.]|nr:hypothetical protein [Candidatus Cloacimonas sp.]
MQHIENNGVIGTSLKMQKYLCALCSLLIAPYLYARVIILTCLHPKRVAVDVVPPDG